MTLSQVCSELENISDMVHVLMSTTVNYCHKDQERNILGEVVLPTCCAMYGMILDMAHVLVSTAVNYCHKDGGKTRSCRTEPMFY